MEKLLTHCQQLDVLLKQGETEKSNAEKAVLLPEINKLLVEFHNLQIELAHMNLNSINDYMASQPLPLQQRFQHLTEHLREICESCQIRIENSQIVPDQGQDFVGEAIKRIAEESKKDSIKK
jgi:hypothetical protein